MAALVLSSIIVATQILLGAGQGHPCNSSRPAQIGSANHNAIFSSPNFPENYPDNSHCEWNISTPEQTSTGTPIRLDFDLFNTEFQGDMVYIYDGPSKSHALIATITGNLDADPVFSTGPNMYIEFRCDSTVTAQGFSGKTNSDPGCRNPEGSKFTFSSSQPQQVVSPHYPTAYPPLENCTWNFDSIHGYTRFVVYFLIFNVEGPSPDCDKDYVEIYLDFNLTGRYCGLDNSPGQLRYTGSNLTIVFKTDATVNSTGFKVNIQDDGPPPTSPPPTTTQIITTEGVMTTEEMVSTATTQGVMTTEQMESTATTQGTMTTEQMSTTTSVPVPVPNMLFTLKIGIEGNASASGTITGDCSTKLKDNLRGSAWDMMDNVNSLLELGQICFWDIWTLTRVDTSMTTLGNVAYVVLEYYMLALGNQTIGANHNCSLEINKYIRDHSNWIHPIIPPSEGCPELAFYPDEFQYLGNNWLCEIISASLH